MLPGVELWGGGPLLSGNFGIGLPKLLSPRPKFSLTVSTSRSNNDLVVILIYSAEGPIQAPVGAGPGNLH